MPWAVGGSEQGICSSGCLLTSFLFARFGGGKILRRLRCIVRGVIGYIGTSLELRVAHFAIAPARWLVYTRERKSVNLNTKKYFNPLVVS